MRVLDKMRMAVYTLILFAAAMGLQRFGAEVNQFTMKANNNMMPVWEISPTLDDPDDLVHCKLTSESRYKVLDDIIPVLVYRDHHIELDAMASVGDIFVFSGISLQLICPFLLMFCWIRR
jgi:hypothetical protein